ncbi:MAG: pilus assembly protein TadG-related protein [Vulcanimicrobiaceae bacterium]
MHGQRGQTLPLIAASLVVLMCFASLAIDVGSWRYQQRLEQTAADSAALAGAVALAYSASPSPIATAAQADAVSNGFTNGTSNVSVTVNHPPLSGGYLGNSSAVEVIVAKPQPVHFALFGRSSQAVSARAVALLSTAGRNCIYALDSSSSSAITSNGGTITMPQCGMISNGSFLFNGQGTVNAASIGYAGSSPTLNNTVFTGASPRAAVTAANPCPTVAGCAYLTAVPPTSGSCAANTTFNSASTITMVPGKYCNQVLFEGGGNVVFSPGVYDFQNGFTNNSAPAMSGTGVTFYIQGGSVIVGSNTVVNLSAPTTGNTQGVLIYQPSSDTGQFILNGTSTGSWAGMVYLPAAQLIIDGGEFTNSLLLVADDILLNAATAVNVPSSSFPGLGGHAVLAE